MKKVFNAKKAISVVLSLAMMLSLFVFAPIASVSAAEVATTADKLIAELDFETAAPKTVRQIGVSYTALRNGMDGDCYMYVKADGEDESLNISSFVMGLVASDFDLDNGVNYTVSFDYYLLAKPDSGDAFWVNVGNTGNHNIVAANWDLRQWYTASYNITGNGNTSIAMNVYDGTEVVLDNIKVVSGTEEIARLTFDSTAYNQISTMNAAYSRVTGDDLAALFEGNNYLQIDATQLENPTPIRLTFDGLQDVDFGTDAAIFMSCDITVERQADIDGQGNKNDLNFRVMDVNGNDAAAYTGGTLWDWIWFEDCGPNSTKPLLENEFEVGVPNHMVKQFGIPATNVKGLTIHVYPGFVGKIDNIKIYCMNTNTEVAAYDFDHPGGQLDNNNNATLASIVSDDDNYALYSNGTNGVLDIDSNIPDGEIDTYFTFPNDFSNVRLQASTEYMVSFDYMCARINNRNNWRFAVIVANKYSEPDVWSTTDTDSSYTSSECPVGIWQSTTVRFTTESANPKFQLQVSGDGEMLFDNFKIYEMPATGEQYIDAAVRQEGTDQYIDVTYGTTAADTDFAYNLSYDTENLTYQNTVAENKIKTPTVTNAASSAELTYKIIDTRSYTGTDFYHEAITYQLKNGFNYNDSYDGAQDYSKATFVVLTYRILEGTPRDNLGCWNNDPTDGGYSQVTSGINSGNWMSLVASGTWEQATMQCHHTPKQADGDDNFFMLRVPTGLLIEIQSIIAYEGWNASGQVVGVADITATAETQEAVPTDYRGMIIDTQNYTDGTWDHVEIPYELGSSFSYPASYSGSGDYSAANFAVITYRVNAGTPADRCCLANNSGFREDGYSIATGNNSGALFSLNTDGELHTHGVQYHHTPSQSENFFAIAVPRGIELEILSIKLYSGWMDHSGTYVYDDDPGNYNTDSKTVAGTADIDLTPLYGEDKLPQLTIDATNANATEKVYFSVPSGYTFTNTTGAADGSCPNGLALHFKVRYFGETADVNGNHLDIKLNGANYYPAQNYKKIVADEGEWANVYVQTHSAPPVEGQNYIEITGFKGCKYDFEYIGICTEWLDASGNPAASIPDNHYLDRLYFAGEAADDTEIAVDGEGLDITCEADSKMAVSGDLATSTFLVNPGFNGELTFTATDALGNEVSVTVDLNTSLNADGVIARYDGNNVKTGVAFGQTVISDDISPYYEEAETGDIYDIIDIGFVVALDKHVDGELTVDTVDPYVQNISVFDSEPESISGDETFYNRYTLQVSGISDANEAITAVPYIVIDDGSDTVIYGAALTTTLNDATDTWTIPQ